jgi:hypothetical protein
MRQVIKKLLGPKISNLRFIFGAPLAYPLGHFYSPICDPKELRGRYRDPAGSSLPLEIAGIDLAHGAQILLWEQWRPFLSEVRSLATDDPSRRYRLPSSSFNVADASIYACMLRYLKPLRLIEVGSGSSSALALDICHRFLAQLPQMTFIEPYPALLHSILRAEDIDKVEIISAGVQDVPLERFDELQRNDILFIDSTHIVKTGSDVVFELFEVLPRLRSGVVVHFHDIFYPFEYPREWVMNRNYSWNELYALRAFLTGNQEWEILFFNNYFAKMEHERIARDAPEMLGDPGGGLWLRRL